MLNELGNKMSEMIDEMESRIGKEKAEEMLDFVSKTEKINKSHPQIKAVFMLGLLVCSDADDMIDLLHRTMATGTSSYREALLVAAPELVEKVDAVFFERMGGDA